MMTRMIGMMTDTTGTMTGTMTDTVITDMTIGATENIVIPLPAPFPEHAGEKNAAEAIVRPGLPLRSRKAETPSSGSYSRSSAIFRHY